MLVCPSCRHENSEGAKFCEECGLPLAPQTVRASEQRKTVTVLFCDLAGSTSLGEALDPERLRVLLARYFERMQAIVELHGGSVEKFIGDAVMAVFGVPVVHEDDALRAVRAAVEMRDALPELELEGRIGVMTGEVVTGTEERLATGDAVNVAARLEQAAQSGEVLIGQPTLALVREAVEVEPVEPLDLKGKSERVAAYRLLRVHDAPERAHTSRFVGRERELALVHEAWKRTCAGPGCELVTVIGDAGVGKSRLAKEFLASVDATVVRGRCLPYGEGITYWPVVEVLKQLGVTPPDEAAAAAISSLLGESEAATSAEEIAWAFRKTLEHAAAERPLAVLFDDVQWGEETFRHLIEHVALLSTDAPVLLLCMARPELAERHPTWPVALRLEPLKVEDVEELMPRRISGGLRDRIARAAGGNPLFVEEMIAMAGETNGDVAVPPTLHALLAARLDQLEPAERSVLERGAIEGEIFHRGAVQALAPEESQVTPRLAALVRKQLIRPDRPPIAGEDGFRFRHLLIRDAAYDALPKTARADLHERFAGWLESHASDLVEVDEILGYHLEQAIRYRAELALPDDAALAEAARRRLTLAARRAQFRADYGAAVSMYERAAALLPPSEIDVSLETGLNEALLWMGKGEEALARAGSLEERAVAARDEAGELCAKVQASLIRMYVEPEGAADRVAPLVEQAVPVFEATGDHLALYTAYRALGWAAFIHAQTDAALEAYERAAIHARQAGLPDELVGERAIFRLYGTTPVRKLLAWLDETDELGARDPWLLAARAVALAMLGRFDDARAILESTRRELAERGGGLLLAGVTGTESPLVELLAGDPSAAAELGAEGCRLFDELDDEGFLSSAASLLAQSLYVLGRLDEAEAWAARAADLGASDDAFNQMAWRPVMAKVLARRGDHGEAERLAREAVAIAATTQDVSGQGDTYGDLAEVLLLAGRSDDAAEALEVALERYERKENVVMASRTRERLAILAATTTA